MGLSTMHSYEFNDNDLGCLVTHQDTLRYLRLPEWNPETLEPWNREQEVKDFCEARSNYNHYWSAFADDPTQEEIDAIYAADNRAKRNQLLADSDWTQITDSALTDEVKTSWATYRTALRALPEHTNWPNLEDADWPVSP